MASSRFPTVLAVRHADIDLPPSSGNPALNAEGRQRADALSRVVGDAGVDSIFTSQFIRTRQTVAPIAAHLGLTPQLAPSPTVLAQQIRAGELGDVVVVAGHSDTIPEILTALGAPPPPPITEAEFDNLYVAAVSGSQRSSCTSATARSDGFLGRCPNGHRRPGSPTRARSTACTTARESLKARGARADALAPRHVLVHRS